MSEKTKHLIVSGRVQGVGFRNYTCKMAKDLSLRGWVRNLKDGKVEVMVQGNDSEFTEFLELVKKGPPMANVEFVEVEDIVVEDVYDDFVQEDDGEDLW